MLWLVEGCPTTTPPPTTTCQRGELWLFFFCFFLCHQMDSFCTLIHYMQAPVSINLTTRILPWWPTEPNKSIWNGSPSFHPWLSLLRNSTMYVSTMNHPFNPHIFNSYPSFFLYIHKLIKEIPRPNAIMARLGSIFSHDSLYLLHMLVLLLLLQACPQIAFSHSMVKFLPGFQGPLPFELETGLVHML